MISIPVQTAYMELLQRFDARPTVSIEGSIVSVEKSGRKYFVARSRVGDRIIETSIGPDNEENQWLVAKARYEQETLKDWSRKNSEIVRMLRSAGALAPDMQSGKILNALSKVGFFSSGGILGGTSAFRLYPLFLGVTPPHAQMATTGDIDILAPSHIKLSGQDQTLTGLLKKAGLDLEPRFGMIDGSVPKFIFKDNIELEILSTVSHSGASSHTHKGINERVSALKYLEYSMKDPVRQVALYRSGVEVLTPSPERYALHKLIVAQLRTGSYTLKRNKDLAQAKWLLDTLIEARPYETWAAYQDIISRGKGWVNRLEASLVEVPAARSALEKLERRMKDFDLDDDE